jgi:hypothetical protein
VPGTNPFYYLLLPFVPFYIIPFSFIIFHIPFFSVRLSPFEHSRLCSCCGDGYPDFWGITFYYTFITTFMSAFGLSWVGLDRFPLLMYILLYILLSILLYILLFVLGIPFVLPFASLLMYILLYIFLFAFCSALFLCPLSPFFPPFNVHLSSFNVHSFVHLYVHSFVHFRAYPFFSPFSPFNVHLYLLYICTYRCT